MNGKIIAVVVLIILAFLVAVAIYDPLRNAVRDTLASAGGSSYVALENGWTNIAATPIYQTYHVFIWLIGGMVLMWAILRLHKQGKIPIFKPKPLASQPQMGAPSTIIIQEQPTPTKTAKEPAPANPPPQQEQQQPAGAS